jgi:cytochrome c556
MPRALGSFQYGAVALTAARALPASARFRKPEALAYRQGAYRQGATRALPKIRDETDRFGAMAAKMQEEMTRLDGLAKSGDGEPIQARVGVTEKACKSCPDAYHQE